MANLTYLFIMVLAVNAMLFMSQAALISIDPNTATNLNYDRGGQIIETFNNGNSTNPSLNTANSSSYLPTGSGSISPTTGNIFTDIFSTMTSWINGAAGLGSFLLKVLSAPYSFLQMMGLPQWFTFSVGSMWYALSLFLLVSFFFGRQLE